MLMLPSNFPIQSNNSQSVCIKNWLLHFTFYRYPELAVYRMKNDEYLKVDFVRGSNKQHFIRDNDGILQLFFGRIFTLY